jgi:hypothetical protein
MGIRELLLALEIGFCLAVVAAVAGLASMAYWLF